MAETYLPRILDTQIEALLASVPVVTVEGARATGKTTTARRSAASEIRLPADLELLASDPRGVLAGLRRPVLIDEWQLAGVDVLWAVKEIVDDDPSPGSFILTGSVQPETYGPTYPLTGRGARVVMYPMTRRELLGAHTGKLWLQRLIDGELASPHPDAGPSVDADTIATSGFPAAPTQAASRWLRAYGASVAERSVDARRDPTRVARLMQVLAGLESAAVPDERIIEMSDLNRATFHAYDEMLQRAFVVAPTQAWRTNRLRRLTSFPKRYSCDAGLALSLAGLDARDLAGDPTRAGAYFESFVAAQLRPELEAIDGAMYHLRTKAGEREIDLILEIGGKIVALEVKWAVRSKRRDARHLEWLVEAMGDRIAAAAVLHRGDATYELAPGVWALPVSTMWA